MKNLRRSQVSFIFSWVMIFVLALVSTPLSIAANTTIPQVKNVIVLVPDGMNATAVALSRWYKGSALTLDEMLVGTVKTYAANSMITDSAPAVTAFATGYKSDSGYISVLPSVTDVPTKVSVPVTDQFRPVATVLEAAKLMGKSTGIIATSNIQHATPAGYSSHWPNRNDYNIIAEQQVYENIDVVLGGGKQYLLPANLKGKRTDDLNLVEKLKEMKYDFVENTEAMKKSTAPKLWGMFADDAMAYEFDRDPAKEPSLAAMTEKAISVLTKNPKGFFLFVEGSKVDWAAHANDPVGVISDVLAFDDAVKVALDFAKKDKHTLILTFADHCTGGMTIGSSQTNKGYDTLKLSSVIDPLKKAAKTGEGLEQLFNADKSNIADVMKQYYGISDLTPEETDAIKNTKTGSMNYTVGPIISKRSAIGWTTTGHTGEEIFLYAYGPMKPAGLIDNTDIAKLIDKDMGLNLAAANKKLFTEVWNSDFSWGVRSLESKYGAGRAYLIITKGNIVAEFPNYSNVFYVNGKPTIMKAGFTYIYNGVPFVPQEALTILSSLK